MDEEAYDERTGDGDGWEGMRKRLGKDKVCESLGKTWSNFYG